MTVDVQRFHVVRFDVSAVNAGCGPSGEVGNRVTILDAINVIRRETRVGCSVSGELGNDTVSGDQCDECTCKADGGLEVHFEAGVDAWRRIDGS